MAIPQSIVLNLHYQGVCSKISSFITITSEGENSLNKLIFLVRFSTKNSTSCSWIHQVVELNLNFQDIYSNNLELFLLLYQYTVFLVRLNTKNLTPCSLRWAWKISNMKIQQIAQPNLHFQGNSSKIWNYLLFSQKICKFSHTSEGDNSLKNILFLVGFRTKTSSSCSWLRAWMLSNFAIHQIVALTLHIQNISFNNLHLVYYFNKKFANFRKIRNVNENSQKINIFVRFGTKNLTLSMNVIKYFNTPNWSTAILHKIYFQKI